MNPHACRAPERLALALPPVGAAWPSDYLGRPGVTSLGQAAFILLVLLALAVAPAYASIQVGDQSASQAIEKVISGQIDAFARDDANAAFSFAAPNIQRQFGNPDRFMVMVMRGYPMVYRPSSVDFLESVPNGENSVMQSVRISDSKGKVWMAFYNMLMIDNDTWRIGGVRMREVETKVI